MFMHIPMHAYCIYINMYIVHIFDSGSPHSPQLLFNHLILFEQQKWRRRAFLSWGRSNLRHMIQPAQTCQKASRPPSWRPPSPTYTWPRSQRPSQAGCGCNKGRASGSRVLDERFGTLCIRVRQMRHGYEMCPPCP